LKHYPIDSVGHVRQGYFFPFDLKGLKVVLSQVSDDLPDWLDALRVRQALIPEEVIAPDFLFEGATSTLTVNAYERNPEARKFCIEHYGARCVVCKVDLGERYGETAEGLIHVHHVVPLSEIGERYLVDPIQDLCPVCPNCHAVIHRRNPPYSVDDVRKMLREKM
jgi:5-methylcytosine-specific restriction protein A